MGIFQPLGAGNTIYLYDDNDGTGRGGATGPHTPAQINAFATAPDYDLLQNTAGQVFLPARPQYLQNVPIVLGGQAADGVEPTSYLQTRCDVFVRNVAFSMRSSAQIAQNLLTFTIGIKTGDAAQGNLGGVDGGVFAVSVNHVFSCNLGIYGSLMIAGGGNFVIQNSLAADYQEFGGSIISHNGNTTFGLGTSAVAQNLFFLNSNCGSVRGATGGMFNNFGAASVEGSLLCLNNLEYFLNSGTGRTLRKAKLSGSAGKPTKADIRSLIQGKASGVVWSGTAPQRVVNFSASAGSGTSYEEYWAFDVKVVDLEGQPVSGIPVYLESDVDATPLVSAVTTTDGNIEFTNIQTVSANDVILREYYGSSVGDETIELTRDRVFTITVNGYPDPLITPHPDYQTQKFSFEWPGLDRAPSGYETDGGTFLDVMMPIRLTPGHPTRDPLWTECEVVP